MGNPIPIPPDLIDSLYQVVIKILEEFEDVTVKASLLDAIPHPDCNLSQRRI
jgi:hypothetical protein